MKDETIGNQQGTPTEAEIAWLSGILEGEGTVTLGCWIRDKKKISKPKITAAITLYNTDAGILKKAIAILEGLSLRFYVKEREQKPMKMANGKKYGAPIPITHICVNHIEDTYRLAKIIRPWMFGEKGNRLDIVVQYLARRLQKINEKGGEFRHACLDYGDVSLVADFYRKFVKSPRHNRELVEGLLNEYEQPAAMEL